MGAIFKREFKSYFTSPVGFAILIIFYFFSGMFFSSLYKTGSPDLSAVFSNMFLVVLCIIPLLTMRLFSEDKRQKTDQLLLTSPVRLPSVVLGKFFAALAVYGLALSIMVVYQFIIASSMPEGASVDWMVFIGNLVGLFLFGLALSSIGLFISSLTESQVVAAIGTLALELVVSMLSSIAVDYIPDSNAINKLIIKALNWFSFAERYSGFTTGTLNYADAVFFISVGCIFVLLTVMVHDRRRYA